MFPVGYRFDPHDDELIREYLLKKVNGEPLPSDAVVECDLYGDKPPWKILEEKRINKLYAFTKLMKATLNRYSRTTPHGTWHGNSSVAVIDRHTKEVIGFRNQLTFRTKKGGNGAKPAAAAASSNTSSCENNGGNWIMRQFSLAGSSLSGKNKFPEYVLCEVYQNKTHKRKFEAVDHVFDTQTTNGNQYQVQVT